MYIKQLNNGSVHLEAEPKHPNLWPHKDSESGLKQQPLPNKASDGVMEEKGGDGDTGIAGDLTGLRL